MKQCRMIKEIKRVVRNNSLLTLLFSLLFASCSKVSSELHGDNIGKQIRFEVSIAPQSRVATDANFKTTWEDGDQVGLFVVKHPSGVKGMLNPLNNYLHNEVLTYSKQTNTWSSADPIYFPVGDEQLDFYAYYPYDELVTNPTNITFNISTDQSATTNEQPNYNRSDVMLSNGTKNMGFGAPTVPLVFSHALAMVQLKVFKSYASPGNGMTATLQGCMTEALGDLSSGTVEAFGRRQPVKMFRLEQRGDANYSNTFTYRALVPAQSIDAGSKLFQIKADNKEHFSTSLSHAVELTAGRVEINAMSNPYYLVGDYYPNDKSPIGIVFWLLNPNADNESEHGKIVSLDETEDFVIWGSEEDTYANSVTDGISNMEKIRTLNPELNNYPAFKWCNDKTEGGKEWYLPAENELKAIYAVREIINNRLSTLDKPNFHDKYHYWSSTEVSIINAISVRLGDNGEDVNLLKLQHTAPVRAITGF